MASAAADHQKTDILSFVHIFSNSGVLNQGCFYSLGDLSVSGDIFDCHT